MTEVGVPDLAVGPIVHHYRTIAVTEDGARIHHEGRPAHHEITVDTRGFRHRPAAPVLPAAVTGESVRAATAPPAPPVV